MGLVTFGYRIGTSCRSLDLDMLYFCRWSGRLQVSLSLSTDVPRGFRGILDRPKRRTRTCIHQPQRTTMCGHVSGYVVLIYQNQLLPQSHSSCCPSHTTYPVFFESKFRPAPSYAQRVRSLARRLPSLPISIQTVQVV